MLDSVQDNRNFYRIEDRAGLEFRVIDEATATDATAPFPIPVSPHFQLLNQLHSIDSDNSQLLRSIGEKDRNVAAYLKGTDQKIELLAQMLAGCNESLTQEQLKSISISEGGLSFHHYESIETGSYLAIKLTLMPSCIGLTLFAKIIESTFDNNGNHMIHCAFIGVSENDRSLLSRHVFLFQAKQRREISNQSKAAI